MTSLIGVLVLQIEPAELIFPAAGGSQTAKFISTSESKMAFKVKSSNNECYRVNPVFGFIEPKGETNVEVIRIKGPPKDDKLVIEWADVPESETDPKAPFVAQAQQGEVVVPVRAT